MVADWPIIYSSICSFIQDNRYITEVRVRRSDTYISIKKDMCWGLLKRRKTKGMEGEVVKRHLTDEEMKALFKKHDGNGDGHLDKTELTEAFKELGSHMPGWRAKQAIHENDLDLDGDIDYHEIDHLVSYVRNNLHL